MAYFQQYKKERADASTFCTYRARLQISKSIAGEIFNQKSFSGGAGISLVRLPISLLSDFVVEGQGPKYLKNETLTRKTAFILFSPKTLTFSKEPYVYVDNNDLTLESFSIEKGKILNKKKVKISETSKISYKTKKMVFEIFERPGLLFTSIEASERNQPELEIYRISVECPKMDEKIKVLEW